MAQDNAAKNIKLWISGVFVFALVWTIGASANIDGRELFSDFVLDAQTGKSEKLTPPPGIAKIDVPIPDYVYDYYFEASGAGKWHHWNKLLQSQSQLEIKESHPLQTLSDPYFGPCKDRFCLITLKEVLWNLFIGISVAFMGWVVKVYET